MGDHPATHADTPPQTPGSGYMAEAELQDQFLRDRLTAIRWQEQSGLITPAESADLRVRAIQHHLEASVALRHEHFGGNARQ